MSAATATLAEAIVSVDELGAAYAGELRRQRERQGLSKRALAGLMAYDRSYIIHIESGRHRPTAPFTRRAEEVLGCGGALWARWDAFREAQAATKPACRHHEPEAELSLVDELAQLRRSIEDLTQLVAVLAERPTYSHAGGRHARPAGPRRAAVKAGA